MKTLSFVIVVMLFTMPLFTLAQQSNDAAQAIFDAKNDANLTYTEAWFIAGIFCGILSLPFAYLVEPSVNPVRFLGKSP